MRSIARSQMFVAATAALAAIPASSALLAQGRDVHLSGRVGTPSSFTKLDANRGNFSELDKLKAKRLSLRRKLPEPEVDVPAAEDHDALDAAAVPAGLEYLYEAGEERHSDDFFHLILMPSTFGKDHMSIEHAAESCVDVLGIPSDKAHDMSLFAKHQGFSCLGTWTRDECLSMGEELVSRDLDCRVIPFHKGVVAPASLPEIRVEGVPKKAFVEDTYLLSFTS
jgi:hypothetical protein